MGYKLEIKVTAHIINEDGEQANSGMYLTTEDVRQAIQKEMGENFLANIKLEAIAQAVVTASRRKANSYMYVEDEADEIYESMDMAVRHWIGEGALTASHAHLCVDSFDVSVTCSPTGDTPEEK